MSNTFIECNRGCGNDNLVWKVVNGKYRLFEWHNQLMHICNNGKVAKLSVREKATAKVLNELGIREVKDIPDAEKSNGKDKYVHQGTDKLVSLVERSNIEPCKMFTINTTSNGISITGDDKHNAIYLPKIAVPELIKALVDFI